MFVNIVDFNIAGMAQFSHSTSDSVEQNAGQNTSASTEMETATGHSQKTITPANIPDNSKRQSKRPRFIQSMHPKYSFKKYIFDFNIYMSLYVSKYF